MGKEVPETGEMDSEKKPTQMTDDEYRRDLFCRSATRTTILLQEIIRNIPTDELQEFKILSENNKLHMSRTHRR